MKTVSKIFFLMLLGTLVAEAKEITIYVNDHFKDIRLTHERWNDTIGYLQKRHPGYNFTLLPIKPNEIALLKKRLERKEIDFLITQPLIYSELHHSHGISRLLTLENRLGMTRFGSVLITAAQSPIKKISQVKGRTVAAVAPMGFGGWLIGYNELYDAGIDPLKKGNVLFVGSQNRVIQAVIEGKADVGIIRSGMLEKLAGYGLVDVNRLRVLNEQKGSYPIKVSTKLFPEWVFAVASHVDNKIAKELFKSMVNIHPDDRAAVSGGYNQWVIPENYRDVDTLLKKFRLAQYKNIPRFHLQELLIYLLGLISVFAVLILYLRYKRVLISQKEQSLILEAKEREIQEKNRALLIQSRMAVMGEMLSMIAHQWRQPLGNITAITSNIMLKEELERLTPDDLKKDLRRVEATVLHMSQTISNFKEHFKPQKKSESITVAALIERLLSIIKESVENEHIRMIKDIEEDIFVEGVSDELLQVLINLVGNAKEALVENVPEDPWIRLEAFTEGESIIIRVCDNGGGISDAVAERIYDPYFSTKKKNGTGLGLYISRTIVEDHLQGSLQLENTKEGVCFLIRLNKELQE